MTGISIFDFEPFAGSTGSVVYRVVDPTYYDLVSEYQETYNFMPEYSGSYVVYSGYSPIITATEFCNTPGVSYVLGSIYDTGVNTTYFDPGLSSWVNSEGGSSFESITCLDYGYTDSAIQVNLLYSIYVVITWAFVFYLYTIFKAEIWSLITSYKFFTYKSHQKGEKISQK